MTPQQISYAKTLTVLGLAGGVAGSAIQSVAVKDPSVGSAVMGTLLGALGVLLPAEVYMRVTGKEIWPSVPAEEVVFAGLGAMSTHNIYGGGGMIEDVYRAAGA